MRNPTRKQEKEILSKRIMEIYENDEASERFGEQMIAFMQLKYSQDYPERVFTSWGSKSPDGLARSILSIIIHNTDPN